MSKWLFRKAKDLVTFRTGKLDSNAAETNGKYPFFTCSQETYRINSFAFDTECVLLAGNNAAGVFPLKYFKGKFNAYQRTYVIETKDTRALDIRYFYFFLRPYLEAFKQQATGATTKFLTMTILNNIEVALPPISTQQKIASILSAYDDLIENNKRRIAILEKMAEEIYREWFVRMRFSSYAKATEDKPISNGKLLLSHRWRRAMLPQVANITYGFPFKSDRFSSEGLGMPIVRIRNIPSSSTNEYTNEIADDRYIIRHGDFLIGMDGEFHMNHWIGPNAYLVQRSCRVKAKDPRLDAYLALALYSPIKHYEATIVGATVGHLGAMHLNKIEIMLPPEEDISQLRIFSELLEQRLVLGRTNRNLSVTRDLLLPRLISGKLSVETLDLPSTVSASSISSALPQAELAHA